MNIFFFYKSMDYLPIIVIVMLCLLAYKYSNIPSKSNEKFTDIRKVKTLPPLKDDRLFGDVTTYQNDLEDLGKTGLDKCIENCNGNCVEFGVTGVATCFHKTNFPTEYERIVGADDYDRGLNFTALR